MNQDELKSEMCRLGVDDSWHAWPGEFGKAVMLSGSSPATLVAACQLAILLAGKSESVPGRTEEVIAAVKSAFQQFLSDELS